MTLSSTHTLYLFFCVSLTPALLLPLTATRGVSLSLFPTLGPRGQIPLSETD